MKLVTFVHGGEDRLGALDPSGRIVDLARAYRSCLRDEGEHDGERRQRRRGDPVDHVKPSLF